MKPWSLRLGGGPVHFDRPLVMGILNVTPDSFSDGGRWLEPEAALRQAQQMIDAGADIIDIGGESTRPGSEPVTEAEELRRVIPVIERLAAECAVPISVDSSKPGVMRAAVAAGASMINDVRALQEEDAMQAAAELGVAVCLMHMQGRPREMQQHPVYADVVGEVAGFLRRRAEACLAAGLPGAGIVVDPGFGFGKTQEHNIQLFRAIPHLCTLGYPLLVGVSRKSMLGAITGRRGGDRLAASVTAAVLAARLGANILRVHDVAATIDALRTSEALAPGAAGTAALG